ncbi:MAG: c-type cytochrome [Gammaproteobacteria bacterium]|nr:c-type cytochrome [Gammaproteobacteria bacterium]
MRTSLLLVASLAIAGCKAPAPSPEAALATAPAAAVPSAPAVVPGDPIEGMRVAKRVGCNGCHGKDGGGKELWEEPGKFKLFSANLTERRLDYDDAGIEALLRHGRTSDGHRPLGMPVFMFEHLSDREVRDITAWLRSIPAVSNPGLQKTWLSDEVKKQVADGTYPYDDDQPTPGMDPPDAPPTDPIALGKHLAYSSCTECHGRELNGWGPDDPTPSLVVAKAYTPEKFARLMKTGIAANGKETKTGFMSEVARGRFAILTDAEIDALKRYLDSR